MVHQFIQKAKTLLEEIMNQKFQREKIECKRGILLPGLKLPGLGELPVAVVVVVASFSSLVFQIALGLSVLLSL